MARDGPALLNVMRSIKVGSGKEEVKGYLVERACVHYVRLIEIVDDKIDWDLYRATRPAKRVAKDTAVHFLNLVEGYNFSFDEECEYLSGKGSG